MLNLPACISKTTRTTAMKPTSSLSKVGDETVLCGVVTPLKPIRKHFSPLEMIAFKKPGSFCALWMDWSWDLKVWNLSIRKFHEIPSFPEIETPPDSYLRVKDIGLGCDPLANDYKHVKVLCVDHNTSVAVYSLGAGSWKIIPFQGKGCSWHWDMNAINWTRKVYLRGSLYFVARDTGNYSVWELVSFDLSSQVFSSIRLPDYNLERKLMLIDGGCSIALLDTCSLDNSMWVLESSRNEHEPMSWTKRYSFHLKFNQFLYFKKNGNMLTRRCRRETLTGKTGKKWTWWDQVASYSPETERV